MAEKLKGSLTEGAPGAPPKVGDDISQLAVSSHAAVESLTQQFYQLHNVLQTDYTLSTAWNAKGFQVDDRAIVSVDGSKIIGEVPADILAGDIPADSMTAELPAAFNAGTGYDAGTITTGDMPAAQMQANMPAAWNANTGYAANQITVGALPAGPMTGNLPAAFNASAGGFDAGLVNTGTLAPAQLPNQGAGYAALPAWVPGGSYAADAAQIQQAYEAIAQTLAQLRTANIIT